MFATQREDSVAKDATMCPFTTRLAARQRRLRARRVARLRRFVVSGFFYSGMYEFDSALIFVALKDGQALRMARTSA